MRPFDLVFPAAAVMVASGPLLTSALSAGLPECAVSCLVPEIAKSACLPTDQACLCTDQALQQAVVACVTGSCTIKEMLLTKNITATACGQPIRDKSPQYTAMSNAFGIVASLFVIQRFAFKFWSELSFGCDDWLTLAAFISSIPSTVFNAHAIVPNGIGRDAWTLTIANIINFCRYTYFMEVLYFADVALIKLALLFFYMRIFPSWEVRRLLWGTALFASLFGITYVLLAVFLCSPVDYYWLKWEGDLQYEDDTCLDINAIAWSNASIGIILDIWMLGIPLWQLKSLRLDWRKKVGVAMMFCVGTFVTIVSVLRLRVLNFVAQTANPTWDFFDLGMWSTVEIDVGIMCVCMPSLRLLLVRLFPRLSGSTQQHYYASHGGVGASRPTARGLVLPLTTGTMSYAERSQFRPMVDANQISCQKTFAVDFRDEHTAKSASPSSSSARWGTPP